MRTGEQEQTSPLRAHDGEAVGAARPYEVVPRHALLGPLSERRLGHRGAQRDGVVDVGEVGRIERAVEGRCAGGRRDAYGAVGATTFRKLTVISSLS